MSTSRSAWSVYLLALATYPLLPVLTVSSSSSLPRLPPTVRGLFGVVLVEAAVFAVFFGFAWLVARPSSSALRLSWRGGVRPLVLGVAYGVALFVGLGLGAGAVAPLAAHALGMSPAEIEALRPHIERLLDPSVLGRDPVYLLVTTTVVSFGLAGLREELWRSAVLTGIAEVFPDALGRARGRIAAVVAASVLFGIGHVAQGAGGVIATALLGAAFGAILLARRSIWEAVLAHGVFDALSFLGLAAGFGA